MEKLRVVGEDVLFDCTWIYRSLRQHSKFDPLCIKAVDFVVPWIVPKEIRFRFGKEGDS